MDLEYHAANHRELHDNGSSRFCLEPDPLDNILIPVSSDNGSENGLRRPPSTCTAFPPARMRSTACRDSRATSLVQQTREPSVCEKFAARASHDPSLSDEMIKTELNRPLPPVFLIFYLKEEVKGLTEAARGVRCHIPCV